jgi:amino-acid N-acetyltransferase
MKIATVIDAAHEQDLPAVCRLLETQQPPLEGVTEHVATMVVARNDRTVVGAAAVELYTDGALLRSVVVDPAIQGQGLGRQLTEAALGVAKDHGSHTVFLLTTTADGSRVRGGGAKATGLRAWMAA